MARLRLAALGVAMVLAACSGSHGQGASGSPGSPGDPIAFPLIDGSNVLSSHEWHATVSKRPGVGDNAVFTEGTGKYLGHDVVVGTQALMPSLEAWLQNLESHPPTGYTQVVEGSGVDAVRAHTRDLGFDFAVFQNTMNGHRHGVVVLAVDPETLQEKAGPVLGVIGKFRLLPQTLRDPIDAQAKKQTGFSLTEATSPDTPIGAAVAALGQLRDFGGRGIVLIDAIKQ